MRLQRGGWLAPVMGSMLLVATSGSAPRADADLFDDIYKKGQPLASTLRTLTAEFTETSTSTLLEQPLVSRGTITVLRPSKILLRYDRPEHRTLLIDGDWLRMTWPSRGIAQQQNVAAAQRRVQRYFVDKTSDELRSHFQIAASTASDRAGTWLVTMVPQRKQISQGLSRLELWIEQEAVILQAMRLTFPSGDTKLMEFDAVKINPPLAEDAFKIAPSALR